MIPLRDTTPTRNYPVVNTAIIGINVVVYRVAVEVNAGTVRLAEFTDPSGQPGFYPYAAMIHNVYGPEDASVVYLPHDFATVLHDLDLALDLEVDCLFDKAERVQILDLHLDAERLSIDGPQRDVGLAAHGALFHVTRRDAQIPQDRAQLGQILPNAVQPTYLRWNYFVFTSKSKKLHHNLIRVILRAHYKITGSLLESSG